MMPAQRSAFRRPAGVLIAVAALVLGLPPFTFSTAETLSVTVERPLAADIVAGMVDIFGNSTGARGVQVSIDSTSWFNATGVPQWHYLWNSSAAPNGVHSVQSRAYNGSQYAASSAVLFTVNNTPPSSLGLTLDVWPQRVFAGEEFVASGMASYENGVRASGGTVQVSCANISANSTTDSRGYYSSQLAAPFSPGKTAVRASMSSAGLSGTALAYIDVILRAPPDLSVSPDNISFDPNEPPGGTQVTINAIVSNPGGTGANGTVRFSTFGHDSSDVVVNVSAGGSWPASVKWSLPSGRHNIQVSILDVLPYDANSSNDNASRELHMLASPDLAVSAIVFSNSRPTEKMPITIQVRVSNSGERSALGKLTFYDGSPAQGNVLDTQNVSLEANSTRSYFLNWNATAGNHNITAVVGNVLPQDPDMSNNELSRQLEVSRKAPPPARTPGFGAGTVLVAISCLLVGWAVRGPGRPPGRGAGWRNIF